MPIEIASPKSQIKTNQVKKQHKISYDWFKKNASSKERLVFTEQMALLLQSGMSLHTALLALKKQTKCKAMNEIVSMLEQDVSDGLSFSQSLAKHPKLFSEVYINLVKASENGGFMPAVLKELYETEEKRDEMHQALISALSYPAFLLTFSCIVVCIILVFIFPQFNDIYVELGNNLPLSTQFFLAISDIMRNYTIWLLLSGLLLILLSRYLVGTDKGKHIIDSVKISLPLVRRIYVDLYLCSSFRSLGLSLSHGVGIVDALKACSNLAHNVHFQSLIDSMIDNVKEGKGIAYGFQNTDIVPVIAKEMVKTGEDSGSLPLIFKQLATHFEQETNKRIKAFSKSIEPILLLFMGTFIGFLISALILPVFSLSSHIG